MLCLVWSSAWKTSWHHQGAAGKCGSLSHSGACSFQLGVRVSLLQWGDFRLQGSPASIINHTNYLADGRWAGGGLVVTAVFQLSCSGHSLSLTSIPQGIIKAIKMGNVNSTSGCFPGSGGFPSSSSWLPLLPPQLRSLAG